MFWNRRKGPEMYGVGCDLQNTKFSLCSKHYNGIRNMLFGVPTEFRMTSKLYMKKFVPFQFNFEITKFVT